MGRIGTCYLVPHPPIIVKEVGRGDEKSAQRTIEAMGKVASDIASEKPEILVVITPHGPLFKDAMALGVSREFSGNFGAFGRPEVSLSFPGHRDMSFAIMEEAAREGIPVMAVDEGLRKRYNISPDLDHGALVPLYFINKKFQNFGLVHITYGLLSPERLYRFGLCIQRAAEKQEGKTSIICSGDLSHRLMRGAPAGYSKRGIEYDKKLMDLLGDMDTEGILNMDSRLIEEAGECAYRSVVTTLGAMDGYKVDANVLSYEGPYGVGYGVAIFTLSGETLGKGTESTEAAKENDFARGKKKDSIIGLARLALENYVVKGEIIEPPEDLPKDILSERTGTFVTIKIGGQLRGCIGTISPTAENIAREIINNAISAGVRDPRFHPIGREELKNLKYSVDVLGPWETIESMDELDIKKYGVIVRYRGKSGLLLPDIEGVDTPEEQVAIALRKAGIGPEKPYTLERFEVIRYQ